MSLCLLLSFLVHLSVVVVFYRPHVCDLRFFTHATASVRRLDCAGYKNGLFPLKPFLKKRRNACHGYSKTFLSVSHSRTRWSSCGARLRSANLACSFSKSQMATFSLVLMRWPSLNSATSRSMFL